MNKEINYEALSWRLQNAINVGKKLGLNIIPGGGYAMDYSFSRIPKYPVGLFGALSIVEGAGARSKLGLTYIQTSALEAGFNSMRNDGAPSAPLLQVSKIKKDDVYLKLEEIGKELGRKISPPAPRKFGIQKKKSRNSVASYPLGNSSWRAAPPPPGPGMFGSNPAGEVALGYSDQPEWAEAAQAPAQQVNIGTTIRYSDQRFDNVASISGTNIDHMPQGIIMINDDAPLPSWPVWTEHIVEPINITLTEEADDVVDEDFD